MLGNHEVVISGIGSMFPECYNLDELQEKLLNGENLVRIKNKIFKDPETLFSGHVPKWGDFDARFFKIHEKINRILDPNLKNLLQKCFEAICDAGINPVTLQGTPTLVSFASQTGDSEMSHSLFIKKHYHVMMANSKAMISNRISYFFGFTGPSYTLDATWNGGMIALETATSMIKKGYVKQAVVGVSNILISTKSNFLYGENGFDYLNKSDSTKSFSENADGYNRSDSVVVLFLQKAEDALRSYATIDKVFTGSRSSIYLDIFTKKVMFNEFLTEFYEDSDIDPNDIAYMECDGCAIPEVDEMELNGINEVICKKRNSPLLVGSCKSMIGHTEGASPILGLINAIIALRTGYIPPTINYVPNTRIKGIVENRIKVVCEKTPLEGDRIAINNIGLCSNYGHVVISRTKTAKIPKTITEPSESAIPKLIQMSGRVETELEENLTKLIKGPVEDGFIAFFHNIYKTKVPSHLFRGYTILDEGEKAVVEKSDVFDKQKVWFVFSGMGSQWPEMGRDLLKFKVAADSLKRSHNILATKGLNLFNIITTVDETIFDDILNAFVGITSIQVALVDLLTSIGITPDGIIGHSVGELGCAYADGCLTAEETVLCSYARGKASKDATLIEGMMAAVGLSYDSIKNMLPPEIEVACHNSAVSCTLSGPTEIMKTFTESLKENGTFVRLVNVANIAYHSKYVAPAGPYLLKYLKEIIKTPKLRSSKWISSSVSEEKWYTEEAKYCSAEYQTNNLLNYVLFEEACKHVSKNGVYIEIAPHGLLQAILKKSFSRGLNISLTNRTQKDGVKCLLKSLGSLFIAGVCMDLAKLYPAYNFPVPPSTRSFQPMISWQETFSNEIHNVGPIADFTLFLKETSLNHLIPELEIAFKNKYFINNESCLPVSEMISNSVDFYKAIYSLRIPVLLTDLEFEPILKFNKILNKYVTLQLLASNSFEIGSSDAKILSGKFLLNQVEFFSVEDLDYNLQDYEAQYSVEEMSFRLIECGLNLCFSFRVIKDIYISNKGFHAKVKSTKGMSCLLDALFTLLTFYNLQETGEIHLIKEIRELAINKESLENDEEDVIVVYNKFSQQLHCKHIIMAGYKTSVFNFKRNMPVFGIDLKEQMFLPYSKDLKLGPIEFYFACAEFIKTNSDQRNNTVSLIDFSDNMETPKEFRLAMEKNVKANINSITTSLEQLQHGLESINTSHSTVICFEGSTIPNKIFKAFKSNSNYILLFTNSKRQLEINDMVVVFEQTLNKKRILLLKRVSNAPYPDIIIDSSKKNWKMSLAQKIEVTAEPVFLILPYQTLSEINAIDKSLLQFKGANNLRFVYTDSSCPSFNTANSFCVNQLKKDFKMNVCRNGMWGCLSALPVKECESAILFKDKIKSADVILKSVAVNLNEAEQTSDKAELGVIEYSGIEDKEETFGISQLIEDNSIEIDPILRWKKPKEWSFEEAATVPLFYCLAYYMLVVKGIVDVKKVILVISGHTNLGQAIIRVALSRGWTVFTTYKTEEEKSVIVQQFPTISESNIFCSSNRSFSNMIMEVTKGRGIDITVNISSDEHSFEPSLTLMGGVTSSVNQRPYYFVMSKDLMEQNENIGMSVFLNNISMFGLGLESVLSFDDEIKKELVKALNEGIKTGVVKPFGYYILKEVPADNEINNIIRSCNRTTPAKKVVINIEKKTNLNQSTNETSSIVIGNYNNLFLSLLRWITNKNHGEVHLVTDKDRVPPFIMRRSNSLRQKSTTFHIESTKILKSSDDFDHFLEKVKKTKYIENVFFITTGLEDNVGKIEAALKKYSKDSHLIAIGSNADRISERRNRDGLKSTAILHNLFDCKTFHSALDLVTLSNVTNTLIISHDLKRDDPEFEVESLLPSTVKDLLTIDGHISDKHFFYEIKSKSCSYDRCKDCNPVFLIPGFHVDKLLHIGASLMYPVFLANFPPSNETNLENLAILFAEELVLNFNIGLYNLVCEGWSGPLTLLIAKHLELKGKACNIFLINGAPFILADWHKKLTIANIVSKYFNINKKDVLNFSWGNIGGIIKKHSNLQEEDIQRIITSLDIISKKISMVKDFDFNNLKISSNLIHFLLDTTQITEIEKLNKICDGGVILYRKPGSSDHSSLLENPKILSEITEMCLYEVKKVMDKKNLIAQTKVTNYNLIKPKISQWS